MNASIEPRDARPLAMAYTRDDAASLVAAAPVPRAVVAMTPDAAAELSGAPFAVIAATVHLDDAAHGRIVARTRRIDRACRKSLGALPAVPETARVTLLSDLHYLCASVFALWFLLGRDGPWLVRGSDRGWQVIEKRSDALRALMTHVRNVGAPVRTWLRPALAGTAVRALNRAAAHLAGGSRRVATSGCSYGMGNLIDAVARQHGLRTLEIRGATGSWRDLAHPFRSLLHILSGRPLATLIVAPEPMPGLIDVLESWWPSIPDSVARAGLEIYRNELITEAALTHGLVAGMENLLETAGCRAIVLNALHWGADVALAEAAGRRGAKRFLISHGTHAPGGTLAADAEQRALADGQLVSVLADTAVCQSPHADALAHQMLPGTERAAFRPTMWGYKELPDRPGGKRRILHAGTYKKLIGLRPWIYETSSEYADGLARLVRAVERLGDAYLVIRFRPMAECDLNALRQFLPRSDCYEIKSDGAFLDDLAEADLLVSYASTTIEEALDARRPVLLWGGSARCRHLPARTEAPTPASRGAVYAADDDEGLAKLLGPILDCHAGAPLTEAELDGHVWPAGTAGTAGVAQLIAETAAAT